MTGLPWLSGTGVFLARDVPAPFPTGVSNIRGGKAPKLHSLLTLGASFIWVPRHVGAGWDEEENAFMWALAASGPEAGALRPPFGRLYYIVQKLKLICSGSHSRSE